MGSLHKSFYTRGHHRLLVLPAEARHCCPMWRDARAACRRLTRPLLIRELHTCGAKIPASWLAAGVFLEQGAGAQEIGGWCPPSGVLKKGGSAVSPASPTGPCICASVGMDPLQCLPFCHHLKQHVMLTGVKIPPPIFDFLSLSPLFLRGRKEDPPPTYMPNLTAIAKPNTNFRFLYVYAQL